MEIRLYNTDGREIQVFEPIEPGRVGMYACGPTVYNYAHIGNLRAYFTEDILRRTLEYAGYEVRHVMNITDVGHLTDDADEGEDKMVKSSREKGMSPWEIADFYTRAFFEDTRRLNILSPTVSCAATGHIDQMIALIRRIEENGYTYGSGGNVYFDTSLFPRYGSMALLDRAGGNTRSRVDTDGNKKNPADFVLWFTRSKFEHQAMLWDSPWGRGYPGWHIECAAMSIHYLGEHIDIHCGGVDHIPVHHTNEIAEAEAAIQGKWVNFWVHNEFLLMDKGKMAKSAGGFITLDTLVEGGYDPPDYRYFLLGAHYRSQQQYTADALAAARSARLGLIERIRTLREESRDRIPPAGEHAGASRYLREFEAGMAEDLNTPKALSAVWSLVKDGDIPPGEKLSVLYAVDSILGLDLENLSIREDALGDEETALATALIAEREEARKSRDFARADEIRKRLSDRGIVIEDTPGGPRWKKSERL